MGRQRADYVGKFRTAGIRVRFTDDERAKLKETADYLGMTVSEYARRMLLNPTVSLRVSKDPKRDPALAELTRELRERGLQLSQILECGIVAPELINPLLAELASVFNRILPNGPKHNQR
jgi:hypothetical protein